jgi:hypothetical protein
MNGKYPKKSNVDFLHVSFSVLKFDWHIEPLSVTFVVLEPHRRLSVSINDLNWWALYYGRVAARASIVGWGDLPACSVSACTNYVHVNNNNNNNMGFYSGLKMREYGRGDPLRWPRDTIYPQKLALTLPTSGGRSVGIVRSRTKATELFMCFCWCCCTPFVPISRGVPRHSEFWVGNI